VRPVDAPRGQLKGKDSRGFGDAAAYVRQRKDDEQCLRLDEVRTLRRHRKRLTELHISLCAEPWPPVSNHSARLPQLADGFVRNM
jgi:hypothetical protein